MRLLIAVDKTRFFWLNQFADELKKNGINCLIINDLDIYDEIDYGIVCIELQRF